MCQVGEWSMAKPILCQSSRRDTTRCFYVLGYSVTPGAYFYGGFDSTFWHFGANAKIKWPATVHWVLHSQVVLKTVV